MSNNIGIYIHIPYCKSKCFYCDFYSNICENKKEIEDYIDAIEKELLSYTEVLQNKIIDTVYIGGGTPSIIDSKYIVKLMDLIKLFPNNIKEATIEVNPESVTKEKLKDYFDSGINRLSIGLQSANSDTLKKIGRLSTKEDFLNAYNLALDVGFKNISLDLIIGLPDETFDSFKETVNFAISLKDISHISAYSLEVHEHSKLNFLLDNNFLTLPKEDDERKMKYYLDNVLENNGFIRYEISNYAKCGYYSMHNLKYWNQEEYIGLGASSSSFINSTRFTNIKDTNTYIKNINDNTANILDKEDLDYEDLMKEYIILRLRLKGGLVFEDFKNKFKCDFLVKYNNIVAKLLEQNLIVKTDKNIYLSYKGEDLANIVWEEFI